MCQDESSFWQLWWFLCRPELPFFVETRFRWGSSGPSATSQELEELRLCYAAAVCFCMFVGKTTICNCTWGYFYKCVLSPRWATTTSQRLATQSRELWNKSRPQNLWELFKNIVSHFLLLWGLLDPTALCSTASDFHSYQLTDMTKAHEWFDLSVIWVVWQFPRNLA